MRSHERAAHTPRGSRARPARPPAARHAPAARHRAARPPRRERQRRRAPRPRLVGRRPRTRARGGDAASHPARPGPRHAGREPAAAPAAGFRGWQREWLAVPEVTSFVAGTCTAGRFHVDDGVVAEIADGVLVLTARGLDTSLQRYASDVPARLAAGPCPCGAAGTVLEVP